MYDMNEYTVYNIEVNVPLKLVSLEAREDQPGMDLLSRAVFIILILVVVVVGARPRDTIVRSSCHHMIPTYTYEYAHRTPNPLKA